MPVSARQQDQNGYLVVRGCPVASSGVFQYGAAQVGLPGDPNRIVNVYRPPEAVSDPEYIASLDTIPLINDHEMLSGFAGDNSAMAPEDYGVDGVLTNPLLAAPWAKGDIKIFSRSMQADLTGGKKDLSLGYTCDFLVQATSVDGVECEVIQTNMRGNHLALVDVGRVPGARILDGKRMCFDSLSFSKLTLNGGQIMAKTVSKGPGKKVVVDSNTAAAMQALLKQLLPVFEQFMGEEAAEPQHQGAAPAAGGAAPAASAAPAAPNAAPAAQAGAQPAAGAAPVAGTDPNAQAAGEAASAATAAPAAGGETGTGEVAAQSATAAGGEGGEMTGEGETDQGGDVGAIAAQLLPLLQKLCAALGGAGEQAAPAAGSEGGGQQAAPAEKPEGGDEGGSASGGEGGAATAGETGGEGGEGTEDAVEGLEGTAREGATDEGGEGEAAGAGGQGTAPAGPAAGKHEGADSALRSFYADAARKVSLVDRLSKLVGAFDGAVDIARSTSADVAAYGVKKLKINCAKGQEYVALDAYLTATEQARRDAGVTGSAAHATQSSAADSADESVVTAYLKKVS